MRANTSVKSNINVLSYKFTYLSQNIEKHAKPNSALDFTQGILYHPFLKKIPVKYIPKSLKKVFTELEGLGIIAEFNHHYWKPKNKPNSGFPRLLVKIPDEKLSKLSRHNNPQHYINVDALPPPLQPYFSTLNNISVGDIQDSQSSKVAFEQILGCETDLNRIPIVYGNNKNTLFAAAKRAMKVAPTPDPEIAHDFVEYSKKIIDEEIGEDLKHFSYSYSQWYNHLPRHKQKLIENIHNHYHHPDKLPLMTRQQYKDMLSEHYEAICKPEIQDSDGKPRLVCAIPQKVKYTMGPVTWQLEEICVKKFKGYCGNKNLTQLSKEINEYAKQGFTKVVEGDGSAFDNTQDISLKEVDRYIYNKIANKIYHVPKAVFKRIANTYYKRMKVKYRVGKKQVTYIDYYTLGTVFSGDCDTTLCNTLRMALYNRYINDKAGLIFGKDYIVFSKGDDFSVLYKPYIKDEFIKELYAKYFLPASSGPDQVSDKRQYGLGQVCKFLDIGGLDSFKFCSLRSWYTDLGQQEITLTRDPSKLYSLSKYSIKYKTYTTFQKLQYHFDLMLSYLINYKGINIFKVMAAGHAKQFLEILKKNNELHSKLRNIHADLTIQSQYQNSGQVRQHAKEEDIEFGGYVLFYETQGRENFYKIKDSYWETMKRITQITTETLTTSEALIVNEQIENEFDIDQLRYEIGLHQSDNVDKLINEVLALKNINYEF